MKLVKHIEFDTTGLQAISYRVDAKKNVLVTTIAKGIAINGTMFEKYTKDYEDTYHAYQDAKEDLLTNTAGDVLFSTNEFSWNYDFGSKIFSVITTDAVLIEVLFKEGFCEE